jgi:hypothetical protein
MAKTTSAGKEALGRDRTGRDMKCTPILGFAVAGLMVLSATVYGEVPEGAPVPDRNPARSASSAGEAPVPAPEKKPDLPGEQPALPWQSPKVNAALAACAKLLEGVSVDYEQLPPISEGACGAPAPILVKSIGADPAVAIEPPAAMRCKLVVALDTWLRDQVQPAAAATLGTKVVTIRNVLSYECRRRYGGANTKISEHAFANALDVSAFVLASGDRVSVEDNWPRPAPAALPLPLPEPKPAQNTDVTPSILRVPATKAKAVAAAPPQPPPVAKPPAASLAERKSAFLHTIHADGCKTFNTMLGPETNAAHRNHFHLDMKVRRYVKICE